MRIEKLGRFGHHPDPAIYFEVEVESIVGMDLDREWGFDDHRDLERRVDTAMEFIVGGDPGAIAAKATLREIASRLRQQAGA